MMKFLATLLLLLSTTVFADKTIPVFTQSDAAVQHNDADGLVVLNDENTVSLLDYVYDVSVQRVVSEARRLDDLYPNSGPIYLVIYSGGGSIEAGIEMINNLKTIKRPVKTVTLFAASMAFHTVQGLGERLMFENSTLMQHKAKGSFSGEFPNGQVDHQLDYWRKRVNNLQAVTAKRSGYKVEYINNLFDNEYWCNVNDCIAKHFADRKVRIQCDKSLSGTKIIEDNHFFFTQQGIIKLTYQYEYENCPLQTNPVNSSVRLSLVGNENAKVTMDASQIETMSVNFEHLVSDRREARPRSWFKREFSFEK